MTERALRAFTANLYISPVDILQMTMPAEGLIEGLPAMLAPVFTPAAAMLACPLTERFWVLGFWYWEGSKKCHEVSVER